MFGALCVPNFSFQDPVFCWAVGEFLLAATLFCHLDCSMIKWEDICQYQSAPNIKRPNSVVFSAGPEKLRSLPKTSLADVPRWRAGSQQSSMDYASQHPNSFLNACIPPCIVRKHREYPSPVLLQRKAVYNDKNIYSLASLLKTSLCGISLCSWCVLLALASAGQGWKQD